MAPYALIGLSSVGCLTSPTPPQFAVRSPATEKVKSPAELTERATAALVHFLSIVEHVDHIAHTRVHAAPLRLTFGLPFGLMSRMILSPLPSLLQRKFVESGGMSEQKKALSKPWRVGPQYLTRQGSNNGSPAG